MDLATLIGGVVGAVLVIGTILMGGSLMAFINIPGIMIVLGGTIAAGMVAERMEHVINSIKVALNAVFLRSPSVENTIEIIVELATVVRKEGLLALENRTIDDAFLARGVRFAVDGMPAEEVQAVLRGELASMKTRHKRGKNFFKFLATTAPAMGMVGTLIGLVQMLQTLSDPAAIGPAMAVALLTTLYGAVLANMVFGPIATKLELRSDEEGANMDVVITGIESIVKGENARVVQEKLEGYLAPAQRSAGED